MVFDDPLGLYQDCSSYNDPSKNVAPRGAGSVFPMIHRENFKNILVKNYWTYKNNLTQMVLEYPSIKIVQIILIFRKTWPPGGVATFFLCIYREILKNLVKNYWANLITICHKWSLGDPLPRLFKY